ncbi:MAG: phosphatase PAP2 family protein, partial [Clostridia bacterium]|nr:phosphatase PAP2 family protein [Clostridia bacterium]
MFQTDSLLRVLESFEKTYGVTDAFKSFPSGHTCSAGTIYALIMIPTLFGYNGKKEKLGATIACWVVPIVYTMLVAISRIMVGAHYM